MTSKASMYRVRMSGQKPRQKAEPSAEVGASIAAIKAEGLSPRQLRLAWRLARHLGLDVATEVEAVHQLRTLGVDPFDESLLFSASESAVKSVGAGAAGGVSAASERRAASTEGAAQGSGAQAKAQLPLRLQTAKTAVGHPNQRTLPAHASDADKVKDARNDLKELRDIQRDIGRRRNRQFAQLFFRLAVFVFLPTFVAGWYYFMSATPLYTANAAIRITSAESPSPSGGGGLLGGGGGGLGNPQDSTAVQSYLESREAMLRLDRDQGFKAHFSQDWIDPIQRLPPDATDEAAYSLYSNRITIGFDIAEGIVKIEVTAADPATAEAFTSALIGYAEERVDSLSDRARDDQMATARDNLEQALEGRREAQIKLVELESRSDVIAPTARLEALQGQLGTFEAELQEKRRQLSVQLNNPTPNEARVDGVRRDVESLENAIRNINQLITQTEGGVSSLTARSLEIEAARADLETRELMLQSAIETLEVSTIEAGKQTRYLSRIVEPIAPDAPSYPHPLEDTFVAFVVLFGIYLLVSVTASILHEQVNS